MGGGGGGKAKGRDTTHWRKDRSGNVRGGRGDSGRAGGGGKGGKPLNATKFLRHLGAKDSSLEATRLADGGPVGPQLASLRSLALVGAQLAPDAVRALCKLRHLTALDLSFGFVGAKGAADLAHHLVTGEEGKDEVAGLTWLNLAHNAVGDAGALALAAALDERAAFDTARCDYYDLAIDGGEGAAGAVAARDAFARAKKARKSKARPSALTYLDLSANRLGPRAGLALAVCLARAPTLTALDVGRNGLGGESCGRLLRAAAKAPSVLAVRGARDAGARAGDAAAFRRAARARGVAATRGLTGEVRTVVMRDADAPSADGEVCSAGDALPFAAGAGPLAPAPPPRAPRAAAAPPRGGAPRTGGGGGGGGGAAAEALARAVAAAAAAVRESCEATHAPAAPTWSPAELACQRLERPCLPAPPVHAAWTCAARAFVPVACSCVATWATTVHPFSCGFRWHLVRYRPLRGGVAESLSAGGRDGDPELDGDVDRFVAAPSAWAWHDHALDVEDLLPSDVLSLWVCPDSPEDLGRQEAAVLVARGFRLDLAESHAQRLPTNAACLDAALLALPFHDSAPLHAFS